MIKKKNVHIKLLKKVLDMTLQIEANTTSCLFIYQPKPPKELMKLKKVNDGYNF